MVFGEYSTTQLAALIYDATSYIRRYQYTDEYDDRVMEWIARNIEIAKLINDSRRAANRITVVHHSRPVEHVYLPRREPRVTVEYTYDSYPHNTENDPSVGYTQPHALGLKAKIEGDADVLDDSDDIDNKTPVKSNRRKKTQKPAHDPQKEDKQNLPKDHKPDHKIETAPKSHQGRTKRRNPNNANKTTQTQAQRSKHRTDSHQHRRTKLRGSEKHDEPEGHEQSKNQSDTPHNSKRKAKSNHRPRRAPVLDPHAILSIPRSASPRAIKRAYLALARQFHPDKLVGRTVAEVEEGSRRMGEVNWARGVLTGEDGR